MLVKFWLKILAYLRISFCIRLLLLELGFLCFPGIWLTAAPDHSLRIQDMLAEHELTWRVEVCSIRQKSIEVVIKFGLFSIFYELSFAVLPRCLYASSCLSVLTWLVLPAMTWIESVFCAVLICLTQKSWVLFVFLCSVSGWHVAVGWNF